MKDIEIIRSKVWNQLLKFARPDSRFHWDFNAFIPDYTGSEQATKRISFCQSYQKSRNIFVTPDNNLTVLRQRCISENKQLIVPTYAIKRGFWLLERKNVPEGQEIFAATLDGMEYFGSHLNLEIPTTGIRISVMVSGASVINYQGVRLSHGPSYFDLEWLILQHLGLIQTETSVIISVHDCQVVDFPCEPSPYQVVPDIIITPTRTISVKSQYKRPDQEILSKLPSNIINEVQILKDLIGK